MKILTFPLYLVFLLKVTCLTIAEEKKHTHYKVLLLTENSLSNDFKNIDKRFSNALSARLADVKMGVITPDTITSGINSKNEQKILPNYKELRKNNKITLARQLGADAILSVNFDSFTNTKAEIPKFDRTVLTFRLVANYQFISADEKSALGGDSIIVEKKIPLTSQLGLSTSENTILSELLDQASEKVSKSIFNSNLLETEIASKFKNSSNSKFTSPLGRFPTNQKLVSVNISANLKDMSIPEIISGNDGQLSLSGNNLKINPGDAEIIINGLTVGMCSNDQEIKIPEGICRMQIKRSGFVVEEKLINAYEGLSLSFILEPTQEEYNLWREQIRFLQEIKTGDTFNKNQIKLTDGMFEYLKNSKYEVPEINLNKSLFQ
ncbi:MAG: hypothetical protein VX609_07045 [Verrucomicrobiota bacterium]|nr:hypothetical protein [Verrucomicrobiota bacterium]MEC8244468.1 hypothetical protein [Verrucomicrobiota bacterium]